MTATDRSPQAGASRFLRAPSRPKRARRTLIWIGAVVLVLLVFVPLFGENGLPAYLRLRSERAELRNEVSRLEEIHDNQELQIEALENDPEVLERTARELYGMQRPGEQVYEVVGEEPAPR